MKSIFISYSHKDGDWKNRLVKMLKVLQLEGLCDVWDDSRIKPGTDWPSEIEEALNAAEVAILMISSDFLISPFIRGTEVPTILQRRNKEGLRVIPVIVKPCPWKNVKWLSSIQAFPNGGVPLMGRSEYEIESSLSALAEMTAGGEPETGETPAQKKEN